LQFGAEINHRKFHNLLTCEYATVILALAIKHSEAVTPDGLDRT
jgi:hypothetical protein